MTPSPSASSDPWDVAHRHARTVFALVVAR
ncbi:MAG: hypothetical protein JWM02_1652 [Frankiales bacterium]|nr:hypothetical protein [Frankiales bacterium]